MFKYKALKDKCRVTLSGEMTIYNAAELKGRLDTIVKEPRDLHINLKDVAEIDSAGVQLMLMVNKTRAALGLAVHWTDPSHEVMDVLDLMGLAAQLFHATVASRK